MSQTKHTHAKTCPWLYKRLSSTLSVHKAPSSCATRPQELGGVPACSPRIHGVQRPLNPCSGGRVGRGATWRVHSSSGLLSVGSRVGDAGRCSTAPERAGLRRQRLL